MLLEHGANINVRAPDGDTLVQIYANLNQFDTVEDLIARGADYQLKTSSGGSVECRVRSREIDPGPVRDAQVRLRARFDAEGRKKTEQVH